ncbi:MAG: stage V sporulation protein AA [Lachnospiraceae bacterium]|nr:stage V sporulation protein AA [Lachnospiraceae bacterium]
MDTKTLYLSLEQSILVNSRKVHIGDIAKIFCTDKDIYNTLSKMFVFTFPNTEDGQQVVTSMKLIELINITFKDLIIIPIGSSETIVYYKNPVPIKKLSNKIKTIILIIFAFFGTGFSIMSYNGDVGSKTLLEDIYRLFTNDYTSQNPKGLSLGIAMYSIGLCIGMIIFFNHGINHKDTDDPTPLQVQMRLYEQNVNQSIILDSERNNKTIDVD